MVRQWARCLSSKRSVSLRETRLILAFQSRKVRNMTSAGPVFLRQVRKPTGEAFPWSSLNQALGTH